MKKDGQKMQIGATVLQNNGRICYSINKKRKGEHLWKR